MEGDSPVRRWEDLDIDILINFSGGHFLDLSVLKSNFKNPLEPDDGLIKSTEICRLSRMWEDLESLTAYYSNPPYVVEEIARSCKNFAEPKIMGPCDMLFASTLVSFLPNLKVLSVRCTVLSKSALVTILDGFKSWKSSTYLSCPSLPSTCTKENSGQVDEST
ncbi:hypothetical protein HAX54_037161 [Datura stramonium]|uniref:Uncharacterized protein n=1 Tax=Datura stramonium TaxID=4076 RepID=A0ABS8VHX0_DATST|nr:hypothetical protein [Datura stramonium]